MTLPPLSEFLTPTPGYPLETPLGDLALALAKAAIPDRHVIVVDDRRQPLGAIALTALATIWALQEPASLLGAAYPQRLMDCSPWLLPVKPVRADQTLGAVLPWCKPQGQFPWY
ncbi:MAG: hypothetical protein HC922_00095 [Leptolyngbyaceae cyanobacterium SM2_3_12]|nr:hypothetical protein [Leptolyngbyaceae cyanobacterium SM2_3_12]